MAVENKFVKNFIFYYFRQIGVCLAYISREMFSLLLFPQTRQNCSKNYIFT